MAAKRPSFQFYSADWLKDPAVRSVSLSARGLWIDMLCLMDQSSRRGYLQHATGKPVTAEQLARMTGCSTDDASRLLQELIDSAVCYSTEHGVLYSKRMVADEQKRQLCQEAGRKGGNPALMGEDKGRLTGGVKGQNNPEITPSSSVSSSSSPSGVEVLMNLTSEELRAGPALLVRYRRVVEAGVWPGAESDMGRFFALAELALTKDKPPGFFRSAVERRDCRGILPVHENRAKVKINALRGVPSQYATDLAARMKAP